MDRIKKNLQEMQDGAAQTDVVGQKIISAFKNLGGMMGVTPQPQSQYQDPNITNRRIGDTIRVDEPEMRSQEGSNMDLMKYLPKKETKVPNSVQPIAPKQEVYDAIDPSEEDPRITARKRALMLLQGQ